MAAFPNLKNVEAHVQLNATTRTINILCQIVSNLLWMQLRNTKKWVRYGCCWLHRCFYM